MRGQLLAGIHIYYYVLYVVGYVLKHPYLDISWMEKCVIHSANRYVYGVLVNDVIFEVNLILNEQESKNSDQGSKG